LTLYDSQNGFFIPNDEKKYSVGENAGMKLDEEGGIEIYVAAEKPEAVTPTPFLRQIHRQSYSRPLSDGTGLLQVRFVNRFNLV
jgi:hypothetical protein